MESNGKSPSFKHHHANIGAESTTMLDALEEMETFAVTSGPDFDDAEIDSVSSYSSDRGTWSNKLESMLSLLGYAVGLGNLWRFPYLCMKNGGGAFLIPFLICLIVCGIPLFFLEVSLGQFLGQGCIHVWAVFPLLKGLGLGMFLVNVVISLYYVMIMAWTMYYLANSFRATLPWSTCDNPWNTANCIIKGQKPTPTLNTTNATWASNSSSYSFTNTSSAIDATTAAVTVSQPMSAEEEYWQYNVLNLSSGLENYGEIQWHLVLVLFLSWLLLFFCVIRGVKSIGKIVYVTALLPYVLLTIFLIRGLTLEGSMDGVRYFIRPDTAKLMKPQVWIEAALQVFFSLGPGWGPLIVMASHNKFRNNCLRDALVVSFIGEGTSIFSGLVVFTILGFIAHELHVPIENVVKSGPGLGFVAYPQALARLPVSQFWSVLFFLMLLTVGVDSMFANVELLLTGITDSFPRFRRRQWLVLLVICALGFICGLPICFQGGLYLFQLYDWYIAILSVPLFGFLEAVVISWSYGLERYSHDVTLMLGRGIPVLIRLCLGLFAPAIIACCFVFTLWVYAPPTYGSYSYSAAGEAFGWTIAVIPLLPLVFAAAHYLIKSRREPFGETLARGLQPGKGWKPHSRDHQEGYKQQGFSYTNMSALRRFKVNFFGE